MSCCDGFTVVFLKIFFRDFESMDLFRVQMD